MASSARPHILFMGDSITRRGNESPNLRPDAPEGAVGHGFVQGLRDLYGDRMAMSTRAVGGFNSAIFVHYWQQMYPAGTPFDRIYIALGANDAMVNPHVDKIPDQSVDLDQYEVNLGQMVRWIVEDQNRAEVRPVGEPRFTAGQVVLVGPGKLYAPDWHADCFRHQDQAGVPRTTCGRTNPRLRLYSDGAERAAKATGATFMNWFDAFPDEGSAGFANYFSDGLHPSALAHKEVLQPVFVKDLAASGFVLDCMVCQPGLKDQILPKRKMPSFGEAIEAMERIKGERSAASTEFSTIYA